MTRLAKRTSVGIVFFVRCRKINQYVPVITSRVKRQSQKDSSLKPLVVLFLLVWTSFGNAQHACELDELKTHRADHPVCLINLAELAFLASNFSAARENYLAIIKLEELEEEFNPILLRSYNVLGLMYMHGFDEGKEEYKAIELWKRALAMGDTQSNYNICILYSEIDSKVYDPIQALPYCISAREYYESIKQSIKSNRNFLDRLNKKIKELER